VNDQWFILAGLIVTFLTTLVGYLQSRRNTKKIGQVHVLVNSQLNTVLARVAQLSKALTDSGTDVPPAPEKPA